MWTRALTLVQAVARLNQDALCRLETPNFDLLSEAERERVMSRFYQEGRRATGQWLYMMEQVLGAEGHKEYAEQFAAMLDDYARKNEPPTADQMEHSI